MASCGQSCTSTASAVRRQVRPAFLKSPTSSFFFRIHADDGFASRLKLFAVFGDVPELGLALRRRAARLGAPGVELGRVAELAQQARHRRAARRMPGRAQGGAQVLQRAALGLGPAPRGIAGGLGGEQRLERGQQRRILRLPRRTPAAGGADALGRALGQFGRELAPTAPNGPSVQAGDPRQQRVPATAEALGFERDEPAALLLIRATDQQTDALVKDAIRVRLDGPASRASAWMDRGGHRQPSSRLTKQASRPLNERSEHLVPCRALSGYSPRARLALAIASSAACSGVRPSATTQWTAVLRLQSGPSRSR